MICVLQICSWEELTQEFGLWGPSNFFKHFDSTQNTFKLSEHCFSTSQPNFLPDMLYLKYISTRETNNKRNP